MTARPSCIGAAAAICCERFHRVATFLRPPCWRKRFGISSKLKKRAHWWTSWRRPTTATLSTRSWSGKFQRPKASTSTGKSMSSNTVPTYASYNVHVKQNSLGALACFPSTLAVSGPNVLINFYIQVEGYSFPSTGAVSFEGTTTQFPGSWVVNSAHLALVDFDGVQGS